MMLASCIPATSGSLLAGHCRQLVAVRPCCCNQLCLRPRRSALGAAPSEAVLPLLGDLSVAATSGFSSVATGVDGSFPDLSVAAFAVPVAGLVGLLGWRFALYGQLEFVTAAMLARYVPSDGNGAVVLQLGGGTKELYYYPKNTLAVTVVGDKLNAGLIDQGGASAGVPATARIQSPTSLAFQPDRSVDAVVALGSLGSVAADRLNFSIAECLRVLKPGCPLIFIERLSDAPASPLRPLLGGFGAAISTAVLERLKSQQGWELVQWDVALEGVDPHAVGVALKAEAPAQRGGGGSGAAGGARPNSRGKAQPAPARGPEGR